MEKNILNITNNVRFWMIVNVHLININFVGILEISPIGAHCVRMVNPNESLLPIV